MEKRISYSQFQSVKCVAKACDPLISKRNKLKEKLDKLAKEYDECNTQISSLEAGIVSVIGFPVDKLVKKIIVPGVDANGQPKKTTKYLPTDVVSYDEAHKQYVITVPEDEEPQWNDNTESATESITEDSIDPGVEDSVVDTPQINTSIFE